METIQKKNVVFCSTKDDLRKCVPLLVQLRPHYTEETCIQQIEKQWDDKYTLVYLEQKGKVVACAGFRILTNLAYGKFLYIDDLITDEKERSKGYGDTLFDWVIAYAKKEQCAEVHLDSGVQRFDAHRFYLRKRLNITAHHFGLRL